MTVMTKGPRALAGSSLRTVLSKAAAAPLSGALGRLHDAAGAIVERDDHDDDRTGQRGSPDLSSRVGPGLRHKRRHQGTGWLVALVGVRVSLCAYALPTIFVGVLVRLLAADA
jgi:phosphate:Na+ symporter